MCPKIEVGKVLKPRLIILSAPSGAGKTTLCERLIQEFPQVQLSVSTTTRPKRPYESDGVHYHFVNEKVFEKKIQAGDFAEWALVHNNRYGTTKKAVDNAIAAGKHLLFDIDVQGAMNLLKAYPERVLLIFIVPPSMEELAKRLRDRKGDSATSIETRLANAYNEMQWRTRFDYQIVNDNLPQAYAELKHIILKECL